MRTFLLARLESELWPSIQSPLERQILLANMTQDFRPRPISDGKRSGPVRVFRVQRLADDDRNGATAWKPAISAKHRTAATNGDRNHRQPVFGGGQEGAHVKAEQSRVAGEGTFRKKHQRRALSGLPGQPPGILGALLRVEAINGEDPNLLTDKVFFDDLTPLHPEQRLRLAWVRVFRNWSGRLNMGSHLIVSAKLKNNPIFY